jgi:sodium-dependent dicarboxylate transporter 2/3/5
MGFMITISKIMDWFRYTFWPARKYAYCWLLPILFLPILTSFPTYSPNDAYSIEDHGDGGDNATDVIVSKHKAAGCGYVLLLMASFWLLEALPMAITAMLPIVFFPLMGILSTSDICMEYMRDTVMIFLASLVAAAAVEESNLHQRVALKVLRLFGTSPQWLLLGFMTNTMFLSMWISNTAATALMIPIIDAVLTQLNQENDEISLGSVEMGSINNSRSESMSRRKSLADSKYGRRTSLVRPAFQDIVYDEKFAKLRKAIYLGICYSANIGGTGTLTGTGTNLILYGFVSKDKTMTLSFGSWMFYAVPGMLVNVALSWVFITVVYMRSHIEEAKKNRKERPEAAERVENMMRHKSEELGDMTFHEHAVLWLFVALIALWFFRAPEYMSGWAKLFLPEGVSDNFIKDSAPAVFIVILYFMIPRDPRNIASSPPLMNWKTTQDKVAWNVVLLLGGGFALSGGAKASGLSKILGHVLNQILSGVGVLGVQTITCLIALFLTEVASNATTATILLGVVENVARSMGVNPLKVMVPLTLSCSYAFVLPVASPPNAIIFEAGDMQTKDMAIPGIVMKIICLSVTLIVTSFWGPITIF